MSIMPLTAIFSRKKVPSQEVTPDYARLIVDNLSCLEKQCRRAAESAGGHYSEAEIDNETDQLLTEVLDHLKADNFKVLRAYRGNSKLTTYLAAVVANRVVDVIRSRKGRSRAAERARELGPLAEKLHRLVHGFGYTLADAHGHLVLSHGISESEDQLRAILEKIRGRDFPCTASPSEWPYAGREIPGDEGMEVIVPDPAKGADEQIINHTRERNRELLLKQLLAGLSGEERLIIRLRFPATDHEAPKSLREIAAVTGQTEKALDNRLRRILAVCRENLLGKGFSLDDLINVRD